MSSNLFSALAFLFLFTYKNGKEVLLNKEDDKDVRTAKNGELI